MSGASALPLLLSASLLVAAPAWAQEGAGQSTASSQSEAPSPADPQDQTTAAAGEKTSPYFEQDDAWKQQRFFIAGFGGGMVGGTSAGLVENLVMRAQLQVGSGALWGGRAGWVFAPRFDVELELGWSSPGLQLELTDLQGQGKVVVPYADVDVGYVMGSVNYSMVERTRRFVPYLTVGIGAVKASSSDEDRIGNTEPGIVYGVGLRARIIDMLAFRADIRGMRSGLGTKQDNGDGEIPGVFVNDFNASFLIWSLGLELRF